MNDTRQQIIDFLHLRDASKYDGAIALGISEKTFTRYVLKLIAEGLAVVKIKSRGPTVNVYGLAPKAAPKPMRKPFLHPVYIDGRRVRNGFEDWLAGLTREAAC